MQMVGVQPFTTPVAGMRSFLRRHHVGAVVMQDGQTGPWPTVMSKLGLSPIAAGGVVLDQVPGSITRAT